MMNERYKELEYEITTDPEFMDEQNAMTPELHNELEPLYIKIMEGKGRKKTIDRILKLIEKHPKNPQLKNYLSVAYKVNGNIQKARKVNRWIIAEHPDYLFGKLNLAAEYFENKEYEKMTEVLGRMMEIQDLYPDRKVFHLAEVTGFNRFAIMYFTATGNQEAAESRYEILEKIAPDHPDTEKALPYLFPGRMEAGIKRMEEEEKTKIRVKTPSIINVEQKTQKPEFTHEEINLLYQKGLYIGIENLDKILALPRETLIGDLEEVLQDCMNRYQYFKNWRETNDWNEETMSFTVHAMYLLGELRAEQSLDVVLEIFRQGEEFLEFWFGDFITGNLWEPLYYIANSQTEKLKQFIIEPAVYTYIRSEISVLMQQIALHQPERKEEVISWFKNVLQYFIDSDLKDNVVDSDAIGLMICELIDINADRLLPEIEKLYELGYVSMGICGDLTSVNNDIVKPSEYDYTKILMNIYDRYHEITTTWAGYREEDEDNEIVYDDYEDIPEILPIRKEPKIGRNDPCPCGSGKKYKKCCLNKSH
jgi:tetratricopeptide (TPR) repeat protein